MRASDHDNHHHNRSTLAINARIVDQSYNLNLVGQVELPLPFYSISDCVWAGFSAL